ncbi:hypothetical protein R1sor_003488 [Riccia sorocarpa]|uniref:Uncharacterized protein n=1 Tax=Riccia sorocarpa TaxID=122646 RepID=A0ABD3H5U8_9MARC
MSANLMTPSLRTAKWNRSQFVPFLHGVQSQNFARVSKILAGSKRYYGIDGDVPVILAEDETRIKPRERKFKHNGGKTGILTFESVLNCMCSRWESRRDTLTGFCGVKDAHTCRLGPEVTVGSGEEGYSRIVDSFETNVIGSYARVIIVNPLHEKLPRLIVSTSVTCNSFNVDWVREHWDRMSSEWEQHCRLVVGPIVGYASDGDSRRRKLMLADYVSESGLRWKLDWEGWIFSCSVFASGDVYGLGDQDPPHNGKKLVNPLDRSTHPLILGDHHACLEHVHLVYKLYPHDMHFLNFDDVVMRDRQNWAGPQRLYSKQVQKCLELLGERTDAHHERTLGTRLYLEVVADYIDIFYSVRLDLYSYENEPDLADFTGLRTDDEFIAALKKGLQEAQNLSILLNMAPHTGVRNQIWWKTPWVSEMELGLFQRGSEVAPDPMDNEGEGFEDELANSNTVGDLWDLAFPIQLEGSDSEQEDGVDDLTILGHETRHVMSEVLQQISSEDQEKSRVDCVPVCILDIGSDCAVLFDTERTGRRSRSRRRPLNTLSNDVWIGRAQKIQRKYNDANDKMQIDEFMKSV